MKKIQVRRYAVATFAAAVAVSLAACGGGGGDATVTPNANAAAGKTTADFSPTPANKAAYEKFVTDLKDKYAGKTLRIIGVKDPWLPAFTKSIQEFQSISGATVTFENYAYDDTYSKEILLGQQKSSAVDVIMFDIPWVGKFAQTGFVEPLDARIAAADKDLIMYDDFYKVMADAAKWDDKVIGIPFAPYFIMMLTNKDILSQAGVTAPKTIEEFQTACKTIKEKTGIAGTAINNQTGTAVGQAYFEWIYNMGGRPFTSEHPDAADGKYYADMTPQFSSAESKATVKMFKDLLSCEPTGATNIAWQERYSSFATGQAAMISPWNYDIPPLDDATQSAVAGKYEVHPVPTKSGVKLNTPVGGWMMGVNAYSTQKDMAWDFTLWFSSPAANAAFLSNGGFSARYSVGKNADLVKQYPWLKTQQEIVDTAFPAFRPQVPEAFEIMKTLGDNIGAYLAGQADLDAAMAKADSQIGTMLKSAGYKVNS